MSSCHIIAYYMCVWWLPWRPFTFVVVVVDFPFSILNRKIKFEIFLVNFRQHLHPSTYLIKFTNRPTNQPALFSTAASTSTNFIIITTCNYVRILVYSTKKKKNFDIQIFVILSFTQHESLEKQQQYRSRFYLFIC